MGLREDLHAQHMARRAKWFAPVPEPETRLAPVVVELPRVAAHKPPLLTREVLRSADVHDIGLERLVRLAASIARDPRMTRPETIDTPSLPNVTVADIVRTVASFYGLSVRELLAARRRTLIVRPRQVAMYLAKVLTGRSLPSIGRMCGGRDHTTVLHAVRKITIWREHDKRLADEIQLILMRLVEQFGEREDVAS